MNNFIYWVNVNKKSTGYGLKIDNAEKNLTRVNTCK